MKLKRFLAPLMAAAITASAIPVANVVASSPRVYIDITYENNDLVRADVIFDNIPPAGCGGFHVNIGDGWDFGTKKLSNGREISGTVNGCESEGLVGVQKFENGEKGIFLMFTGSQNHDLNGRFYSFYLKKNENFNSKNADVNVVFQSTPYVEDMIASCTGTEFITANTDNSPRMIEAQEYIIGDANNDGRVNAIDASWVRMATENNKRYIVKEITESYKDIFPEANCAAAPDATSNGVINSLDADEISQYYADMSTIGYSNTDIGKREFYEIFE